uniref:Putative secreted peptide n=1 Tax=Anopheles braziliensis TaxID=58242 RepID=A0A2M3ZNE2_9DIPT
MVGACWRSVERYPFLYFFLLFLCRLWCIFVMKIRSESVNFYVINRITQMHYTNGNTRIANQLRRAVPPKKGTGDGSWCFALSRITKLNSILPKLILNLMRTLGRHVGWRAVT